MAKLYAEITSDKGGRVASKGGNNELQLNVKQGNIHMFRLQVRDCGGYCRITTNYKNGEGVHFHNITKA